jgi:hypothetical protein
LSFAARVARAGNNLMTPFTNLWRSRRDLRHVVLRPHRAEALFLGDGVSLDQVDGAWRDRFCDPLIAELHRQGATTLLMQRGNLDRLPSDIRSEYDHPLGSTSRGSAARIRSACDLASGA